MTAPEAVRIPVDGLELVGDLRRPHRPGAAPALVFTGPLSGVRDQVVGTYAERLSEAGFATLAFDHRGFGDSGGSARQHEDPAGKLADLRAAVGWLRTRPEVRADAVGVVGVCLGGAYALRAAASDPRVAAVACVAAAYNSPAVFAAGMGLGAYRAAIAGFLADAVDDSGAPRTIPAVRPDEGPVAMPGAEPWAYYGTSRSTSAGWRNEITTGSLYELMTFDALGAADLLGDTPLLVVHGRTDAYCPPSGAQAAFDRTPGPRELVWLDTDEHIDLYDRPRFVDPAVDRLASFFSQRLGATGPD